MTTAIGCIPKSILCVGLFVNIALCDDLDCDDPPPDGFIVNYYNKLICESARNMKAEAEIKDSTDGLKQYIQTLGESYANLGAQLQQSDSLWNRLFQEDCWLKSDASYPNSPEGQGPVNDNAQNYENLLCRKYYLEKRKIFLTNLSSSLRAFPPSLLKAEVEPKRNRRNK